MKGYSGRSCAEDRSPYVAMVRRGHQSSVARLRRTLTSQLQAVQAELATARAAISTARATALDDAVQAIGALPR